MDSFMIEAVVVGLACAALVASTMVLSRRMLTQDVGVQDQSNVTMVFHGDVLIDADDRVWPLLSEPRGAPTWDDIRLALRPMVPELPDQLCTFERGTRSSELMLAMSQNDETTRIVLQRPPATDDDWLATMQTNAFGAWMKSAVAHAPDLIWCLNKESDFVWGNNSFTQQAATHGGPSAFAEKIRQEVIELEDQRVKRVKLTSPDGRPSKDRWLEVTVKQTDTGLIYFASGIDAVIQAESAQQTFVQTLSKTFANLTTGLAIFDRDRRLVLFNPALVDLSRVPIEFLSARPAMFEFFDKLRDYQIMPEPKSYDDWRERMAKLVAAASDDRFRETWTLSSGQTFDVTGQPYPDGAIAFLFNDISAEVSLTRGLRTELDVLQSVIDTMEDAVAVFDSQGILTVCNTAYGSLWNVDPEACIPETTIVEATQSWKSAFHPSPVWPELRDFVTRSTERVSWDSELRSKDGREAVCRIDPICHGATLIRFCHSPKKRDTQPEVDGLQIVSA